MKTARIQTNQAERIAHGVVTLASLQSVKTAMHTLPKLARTNPSGFAAIGAARAAGGCGSFDALLDQRDSEPAGLYGHDWKTANIRGAVPS